MRGHTPSQRKLVVWCASAALAFLALLLHRLAVPTSIYFDEVHYVKAARKLLELMPANREHPMFAKEAIAASIALLGDTSFAWRLPSAVMGALGLFSFGMFVGTISKRLAPALVAMILLMTNFLWFIESRIAMLDIYAASFSITGLWQFAASLNSRKPRLHMAVAGIAIGLALGSKWSAVPIAILPGLAFLYMKLTSQRRNQPWNRISIFEAALWLGLLPLIVYWLTFAPAFFYPATSHPVNPLGFISYHREMIELQDSVTRHHVYQSVWYQWVLNLRPIWFLYEVADGAQRGVLMVGNPFTMLAGLPALAWCLWAGIFRRRTDALVLAGLYLANIGFWIVSNKPVQFYYHYLLPGTFLMGCLALALVDMWQKSRKWRAMALATIALSLAMFGWFYPIISAAALPDGKPAYQHWMWLDSWR